MDLQTYVVAFISFVNGVIIPFLIGIAFLFFLINVIRYFVIGAANDESREKARSLALYSILAFVFILIFWGIVNMLADSFALNRDCYRGQVSDYIALQAEDDGSPRSSIEPCAPSLSEPPAPEGLPLLPSPETSPDELTAPLLPPPPPPDSLPDIND